MLGKAKDMAAFAVALRVIRRAETLIIEDYRPTLPMLLAIAGVFVSLVIAISIMVDIGFRSDSFGLWAAVIATVVCFVIVLFNPLRESYYFDAERDSYALVRQYAYKREVIEGALSQFTGASVKTIENEDSETYRVVLNQEGMFLTGVTEQFLRETTPIPNTYGDEARMANAISAFLADSRFKKNERAS